MASFATYFVTSLILLCIPASITILLLSPQYYGGLLYNSLRSLRVWNLQWYLATLAMICFLILYLSDYFLGSSNHSQKRAPFPGSNMLFVASILATGIAMVTSVHVFAFTPIAVTLVSGPILVSVLRYYLKAQPVSLSDLELKITTQNKSFEVCSRDWRQLHIINAWKVEKEREGFYKALIASFLLTGLALLGLWLWWIQQYLSSNWNMILRPDEPVDPSCLGVTEPWNPQNLSVYVIRYWLPYHLEIEQKDWKCNTGLVRTLLLLSTGIHSITYLLCAGGIYLRLCVQSLYARCIAEPKALIQLCGENDADMSSKKYAPVWESLINKVNSVLENPSWANGANDESLKPQSALRTKWIDTLAGSQNESNLQEIIEDKREDIQDRILKQSQWSPSRPTATYQRRVSDGSSDNPDNIHDILSTTGDNDSKKKKESLTKQTFSSYYAVANRANERLKINGDFAPYISAEDIAELVKQGTAESSVAINRLQNILRISFASIIAVLIIVYYSASIAGANVNIGNATFAYIGLVILGFLIYCWISLADITRLLISKLSSQVSVKRFIRLLKTSPLAHAAIVLIFMPLAIIILPISALNQYIRRKRRIIEATPSGEYVVSRSDSIMLHDNGIRGELYWPDKPSKEIVSLEELKGDDLLLAVLICSNAFPVATRSWKYGLKKKNVQSSKVELEENTNQIDNLEQEMSGEFRDNVNSYENEGFLNLSSRTYDSKEDFNHINQYVDKKELQQSSDSHIPNQKLLDITSNHENKKTDYLANRRLNTKDRSVLSFESNTRYSETNDQPVDYLLPKINLANKSEAEMDRYNKMRKPINVSNNISISTESDMDSNCDEITLFDSTVDEHISNNKNSIGDEGFMTYEESSIVSNDTDLENSDIISNIVGDEYPPYFADGSCSDSTEFVTSHFCIGQVSQDWPTVNNSLIKNNLNFAAGNNSSRVSYIKKPKKIHLSENSPTYFDVRKSQYPVFRSSIYYNEPNTNSVHKSISTYSENIARTSLNRALLENINEPEILKAVNKWKSTNLSEGVMHYIKVGPAEGYITSNGIYWPKAQIFWRKRSTFTWRIARLAKYIHQQDYMAVIKGVYMISALAIAMNVVISILTMMVLASVNMLLAPLSFGIVIGLFFVIGCIMFLLPPVPGIPVYMLGGALIPASRPDGWGFWPATILACFITTILKLFSMALQQQLIGRPLRNNTKIRSIVGCNKPFIRSIEIILNRPGISLEKAAILAGGPDWPTSVLTGILKLKWLPVQIATIPGAPFMIISTIAGALMLMSNTSAIYQAASTSALSLTVLSGTVLTIAALYYIDKVIATMPDLVTYPRIQDLELDWISYKQSVLRFYKLGRIGWRDFPKYLRVIYIIGAVASAITTYLAIFVPDLCFGYFTLQSRVDKLTIDFVKPLGWVLIGFSLITLFFYLLCRGKIKKAEEYRLMSVKENLDSLEPWWKWIRCVHCIEAAEFMNIEIPEIPEKYQKRPEENDNIGIPSDQSDFCYTPTEMNKRLSQSNQLNRKRSSVKVQI